MARTPEELFAHLEALGIEAPTTRHAPLFTVAESQALRGSIEGAHTKNLFLKDKKGRYFLVTVEEEAEVDLKSIHNLIGASGRVSFGKPDALMELLGVEPGAVTVLGLINDGAHRVTVILDANLMANAIVNCHPLTNGATTSLTADELLRFVRSTGHEPFVLNVSAGSPH